jgi:hypothetical protein
MTILCNYFTSTNLYHVCVIYRYLQKLRPQKAFLIKFEFESDKKKNCVLKKYVIDKELQHTEDFIFCVALFAFHFVLEKIS